MVLNEFLRDELFEHSGHKEGPRLADQGHDQVFETRSSKYSMELILCHLSTVACGDAKPSGRTWTQSQPTSDIATEKLDVLRDATYVQTSLQRPRLGLL